MDLNFENFYIRGSSLKPNIIAFLFEPLRAVYSRTYAVSSAYPSSPQIFDNDNFVYHLPKRSRSLCTGHYKRLCNVRH